MADREQAAIFEAKARPGGFRERRFVVRHEIAGRMIERGDHLPAARRAGGRGYGP